MVYKERNHLSYGIPLFNLVRYCQFAAAAKLLQSCPTLCNPIDCSPSGSPVPGIPQARTLEWVAISFSNAWKWKMKVKSLSRVRLLATPWTAAYQAPPPMGFSRQKYWSGVPLPSPCQFATGCLFYSIFQPAVPEYSYISSTYQYLAVSANILSIWQIFGDIHCYFNLHSSNY